MGYRSDISATARAVLMAGAAISAATWSQMAIAGEIEGTVSNVALDRPLRDARVSLEGYEIDLPTGDDGRYRISNLAAGLYTLVIARPGYEQFQQQVDVPQDGTVIIDAALRLEGAEDIVVTGARASRLLALERKRNLSVVADVVSSDGIGKLPDYNTAEALQRLPGVSVEIDQGEPRYVVIRGIDPNLTQVTVDGNLVGIPEAEGRRVALDTIPSDLVAAIEVTKTTTPDLDGNAIGGTINIVTPTAFDRNGPFTFVSARGAYNGKSERLGFGGSATHGRKFGADETFGVVVAGSYFKRFIDSNNVGPINWTTVAGVATPTAVQMFDYRIMRERIGGIVNLDWRPDPATRFYLRTIYNEFTDKEERDQFDFALAAPPVAFPQEGQISFGGGRATREFRQNNQTQRLYNISPGAEFVFGPVELSLNYVFAHAEEHTPIRDDIEFRSARGKFATIDVSKPIPTFVAIDPSLFEPAAFPLRRIRLRREQIDEDLHAVRADMKVFLGENTNTFVKLGGKYIDRSKDRDNQQELQVPTSPVTFADTNTVLPPPDSFFNGEFEFGPRIDYLGVLDFFASNPSLIVTDPIATARNNLALDYQINEKIYAGYAMLNGEFDDLTIIAGVRVEHTEGQYNAFAIRDTNGDGIIEPADFAPLSFEKKYTNVLPSAHLIYRPASNLIIRGAFTNTLGRPNYDAIVPTFEEDSGVGEAGNPDLEPFKSLNLDLSLEYYPDSESVLSVAVFHKSIENPIFIQTIQNTTFAGVPLTSLSQPLNADDGRLTGIEANIVRRLTFLPAPFDGLGISGNVTYVDSNVNVPGREDEKLPFFRQSDWLASGALFYEKGPVEARIAFSYNDDYIVNVGSVAQGTTADVYNKSRFVLDARASYRIMNGVEVFASASNITDASLTFFQTTKDQIFTREIYGVNADFGISAQF